ncbi:hypothetical protein KP78_39230 [Jeotgalibacillus soli]|uniref:Activator of Hsp90 ATPase homologue 1/2-like C-terminal domain-containing protein n=1 Tax=Jeotgalibacillus soli TaxID=889306 RepID=A0A0C2QX84_9BACL|nr:hypothetical protein KP78_39230 [Jeotgalibacillus soli]
MNTQITTKFKILKPANEVFETIVDPIKIGHFRFYTSSERWEQGKTVTLRYDEYDVDAVINVVAVEKDKKIVFSWGGEYDQETVVTITLKELDHTSTNIEVNESGWKEDDPEIVNKMLGHKKVGFIH